MSTQHTDPQRLLMRYNPELQYIVNQNMTTWEQKELEKGGGHQPQQQQSLHHSAKTAPLDLRAIQKAYAKSHDLKQHPAVQEGRAASKDDETPVLRQTRSFAEMLEAALIKEQQAQSRQQPEGDESVTLQHQASSETVTRTGTPDGNQHEGSQHTIGKGPPSPPTPTLADAVKHSRRTRCVVS